MSSNRVIDISANAEKFKFAWALMPVSKDELSRIPVSHRVRPYLLTMNKENEFYAFPSSSQVTKRKSRYENENFITRIYGEALTLTTLDEIFLLPKDNIHSEYTIMPKESENEVIKKLQSNCGYCHYPVDFREYIQSRSFYYDTNDLVLINSELYLLVGKLDEATFLALRVYQYKKDKTFLRISNGQKYYIDVFNIYYLNSQDINKYYSRLACMLNISDPNDLDKFFDKISCLTIERSEEDLSLFKNLVSGTIIKYYEGVSPKKMIILENKHKKMIVATGNEELKYSEYSISCFPKEIDFDYTIEQTLTDERTESLLLKL